MSEEKKNEENKIEEKDFKVINETIVPKKKSLFRRAVSYLFFLLISATIFGVVERAVFELTGEAFFRFDFSGKGKNNIALKKEVQTTGAAVKPDSKTPPTKTENIIKNDIKVVEKKIDAKLSDYATILKEFGEAAEKSNASVVEVQSVIMGTDWFENPYETVVSASGFIMAIQNDYAYILTKYSKIKKATNIKVSFRQGFITEGTIKNYDAELDYAIVTANLKVVDESVKNELQAVKIGDTNAISIGQPVMALGDPDGIIYSVLFGAITNTYGKEYVTDYTLDAFYTDVKLSKEGSGILLDTAGNMIGLIRNNSEGSCKVISINRLIGFFEKMINDESIPYLGIVTKEFAGAEKRTGKAGGILIDSVAKGSPAEDVGIKKGDIIYEADGAVVRDMNEFSDLLEKKKVGDKVRLSVYRVTRNQETESEIEVIIGDGRGVK